MRALEAGKRRQLLAQSMAKVSGHDLNVSCMIFQVKFGLDATQND